MTSESLQRMVDDAWRDMFELHSGKSLTTAHDSSQAREFANKTDVPIIVPAVLQDALKDHGDQDAVKQAIKELVLSWFWKGYYNGFQDGLKDSSCEELQP